MASFQSSQAVSIGARLTVADVAAFHKFNSYPWIGDKSFLHGLSAMVGPLTGPHDREQALGASLHARVWWYKSKYGLDVDLMAYQQYLAEHPGAFQPDPALLNRVAELQGRVSSILAEQEAKKKMMEDAGVPTWQIEAPTADLLRKADDGASTSAGPGQDAPYPEQFQAIVEAVTTGKQVPGIRDIPNNVVRVPGISPLGKMQAPPKPWEKRHTQQRENDQLAHERVLDADFPDVEDDTVPQVDHAAEKRKEDEWTMREG